MESPIVALDARLIGGHSTGDSTYWTGLLHGLSRVNNDLTLLLYSNAPRPEGVPDAPNVEWVHLPARRSRWWSLVKFPLHARRQGARCIHVQYSMSPLIQDRGVTTVHDVSFFIGPEWFQPRDREILRRSVPAAVRQAAAVITVSETGKAEIEKFIPSSKGKIVVTLNACPPWVQPMKKDRAKALVAQELGIRDPFVFTLGTQWPRKNVQLAIDAVEGLGADLPHRLVVTGKAGWGGQRPGRRTITTGYVDQRLLGALYSAADAYLAPSRHEGFGIPVLEAFRCGCPVMASAGGALPEVVGNAGHVERSWAGPDWTARLESLLRHPSTLDEMAAKGIAREKLFSWEHTARETLSVYRQVLR